MINRNTVWHAGNDGALSTLDADLLDGQQLANIAPVGLEGQVSFLANTATFERENGYTLVKGYFIETAGELSAAQSSLTDYATIFNTWTRFSHDGSASQPANSSELSAWSFDSNTGIISSTTNSGTFIGFVSPESYSDYVLKVQLKSSNADNDTIGVLFGWYVDPSTGREYTLSALRDTGGTVTGWEIWYNYLRSDQQLLVDGSSFVSYSGGWSSYPDGTTVEITRTGNQFSFVTSQLGNTTLDTATTLTLDLNSLAILDKFKGQSPYGFGAYSQASASFTVLNFSSATSEIFDVRNGDVYTLSNGSWVVSPSRDIWTDVGIGRFVHNETTGKTFYVANSAAVIKISEHEVATFTNVTSNILNVKQVFESTNGISSATGTVTHNCALGQIFIHSSISANFTANFTNATVPANNATAFTLVLNQGATAYVPTAVQINSQAQTINWQGGTQPAGSANKKDVVSFSVVNNNGTWITLGQLTTFG
jgi:hypothetical protein